MEIAKERVKPGDPVGMAGTFRNFNWVASSVIIFVGFVLAAAAEGWRDQQVLGYTILAAGIAILPPVLDIIRRRWAWSKPRYVPATFAVSVVVAAIIVSPLFAPTAAEQTQLRASALAAAERLLANGDLRAARSRLSKFIGTPDPDHRVAELIRQIDQAAKAKETAAQQNIRSAAVAAPTTPAKQAIDFPHLKPATRFSEYGIGDEHRTAQDALNAGDVGRAYNMFGERNRSLDGPREKRFDDVLETAFQQWSDTSPASDFAERVQTYWLPQLKALPTTPPADTDEYGKRLSAIQEFAQVVADAEGLTFSPAQLQLVARFRAALSAKQIALFPILRRRYSELLNEKLFRSDIEVRIAGPAARTLRLTSGAFALNASIEDMQTALGSTSAPTRS